MQLDAFCQIRSDPKGIFDRGISDHSPVVAALSYRGMQDPGRRAISKQVLDSDELVNHFCRLEDSTALKMIWWLRTPDSGEMEGSQNPVERSGSTRAK